MRVAVNNHSLPIYKKNRIASLLCIFKSTIKTCVFSLVYNYLRPSNNSTQLIFNINAVVLALIRGTFFMFVER